MKRTSYFSITSVARSLVAVAIVGALCVQAVDGAVIRVGFDANTLAATDDGSTGLVNIGFDVNFFGTTFSQLYVNNNGNVTFDSALSTFTPFPLTSTDQEIIAPFFADVDTRYHGSAVTYGTGTVGGRDAFGVNWVDVDYYSSSVTHGSQLNSFQLVLIDRSDISAGDFDMEFNYDKIVWETGNASGGSGGLGGDSARVGYAHGTETSLELAGSAVNGAFLDSNPTTGLINNNRGSAELGRYVFEARDGELPVDSIPEPTSVLLAMAGLAGIVSRRRRKHHYAAD